MDALSESFLRTIDRENLFPGGEAVTAAVSGGADSIAMLTLLARFAPSRGWRLSVLHINHRLRQEAFEDQSFVERTARTLGIPFRSESPVPVESGSVESRWSEERSALFSRCDGLVAVAHNARDRAETILLRLFEGAGLRGLGGMDYFGAGPVRRPMLDLHPERIRSWLVQEGIAWVEDLSNAHRSITRNRLRHDVMPVIESGFPGALHGICRSGSLLSAWRDLQDQLADCSGSRISRKELLELPPVLASLVLWHSAGRPRKGFREFMKVLDWLAGGGSGRHLMPGGKRLVADGETLLFEERGSGRY